MSKEYDDFLKFDGFMDDDDDDDEIDFGGIPTSLDAESEESGSVETPQQSVDSRVSLEKQPEESSFEENNEFEDDLDGLDFDETDQSESTDDTGYQEYDQSQFNGGADYSEDNTDGDFYDTETSTYDENYQTEEPINYQDEYSQDAYEQETINPDNKKQTTDESVQDYILYVITDRPFDGLINYMREHGLNVSVIFSNIDEARNYLLMQTDPYRLVVLETGLGKFTSTNQRKQLIDLLGMCTDEESRASVYFTDSVLKIDVTRALGKSADVTWEKYRNTAHVVSELLKTKEHFVLVDEQELDEIKTLDDYKDFKGLPSRETATKGIQPIITFESIRKDMMDENDGTPLEGFEPAV